MSLFCTTRVEAQRRHAHSARTATSRLVPSASRRPLRWPGHLGADPAVYGSYGRRLSDFIRELRSLGGSESKLRRYQDAFEGGRRLFPGNRSRCARVYQSCQYDLQQLTDLMI
ncbi:hypothetical protein HPB48_016998 [Haemaphysalis longicornis]|uniref:Uncharacterized protein n=1 Tax=Haemaphysalis longicornis TaxID=44386 RepID=A0A9J6G8G8_HAELO|nr:hypothetical protein HPB48_016998 [Haemaphysalis longicornis]